MENQLGAGHYVRASALRGTFKEFPHSVATTRVLHSKGMSVDVHSRSNDTSNVSLSDPSHTARTTFGVHVLRVFLYTDFNTGIQLLPTQPLPARHGQKEDDRSKAGEF